MSKSTLNWKVAGAAGEGVKSTGLLFSKSCLRHGLYTFDYSDYPSLIRGGHNTYQVHASTTKVYSQVQLLDVLVALNKNALLLHQRELNADSFVLADLSDIGIAPDQVDLPGNVLDIPFAKLAKDAGADRVMLNNVALGSSVALLNLDLSTLNSVINDVFGDKGTTVVQRNQDAAKVGFDYVLKNFKPHPQIAFTKQKPLDTISLTGNDMLSLGAIAGGMTAYIAYPMTPSSSILHILSAWAKSANILVKHAEDEIGVINMALGASYAGVRSAVGTSGGGFTYMTEAVGMAGVAELPLVIFECQRPGPALGMPTWTAQADLLFVINASQDEFPRVVLSPGDVDDAFELSRLAFDLAEDFQIPVIVLSDKHLSESAQSTHLDTTTFSVKQTSIDPHPQVDDTGLYPRYQLTSTGVSPRSIPGTEHGFYIANSYEADIHGLAVEDAQPRIEQMNKRMQKYAGINQRIPQQYYDGSDHPAVTFISFGSTKGVVRQGVMELRSLGIDAAMLNLSWVWPFPSAQVIDVIERSQNPVVVEGNYTHQLAKLIRQETGLDVYHKRTRYDGRPFYPHQIVNYAKEILGV